MSLAEARAANERFAQPADGTFDYCFVCGRSRRDGFHLFTGPVSPVRDQPVSSRLPTHGGANCELTGGHVASPWTPPAWAADPGNGDGTDRTVAAEFIWAALDCPGYFALHGRDLTVAFLVRQQVEILSPIRVGVEYVVVGRELERSGRKGLAATAILDAAGEVLAHAECLMVVPRGAAV